MEIQIKGLLLIILGIIMVQSVIVLGFKVYELIYIYLDGKFQWWNKRIDYYSVLQFIIFIYYNFFYRYCYRVPIRWR